MSPCGGGGCGGLIKTDKVALKLFLQAVVGGTQVAFGHRYFDQLSLGRTDRWFQICMDGWGKNVHHIDHIGIIDTQ